MTNANRSLKNKNRVGYIKMATKHFKAIFLLIIALLTVVFPVSATVSVDNVVVTADTGTAYTNSVLDCAFTISGNLTSYSTDVTWYKNGTAHTADDQTITASNNTLTHTTSVGDIEAGDLSKTDVWTCEVTSTDGVLTAKLNSSTVTIANSAPSISTTAKTTAKTGVSYSYDVNAADADGDTLTYSLTTAPTNMTINSATGVISWTASEGQAGSHSVVVEVADTDGATDTQSYTVTASVMKLAVDKLDVSCSPSCNDDLNEEDGGEITEVEPGTTLEFKVKLENLWDDDEDDHNIENIDIVATLEEMGDEDDQEEEDEIDKIKPGDKESVTFTFEVPEEVDEGTYDLELEIDGEDEDGTDYDITLSIEVEVEKKSDQMTFKKAMFTPSTVRCSRETQLSINVKNIGSSDQDNAQLTIRSSPLGISENDFFDVEEGDYDDDDTEFEKRYSFNIPTNVRAGTYDVELKAYYEDDDEYERKTVTLTVEACDGTSDSSTTPSKPTVQEPKEEVEVIQQPIQTPQVDPTQTTGPVFAKPVTKTEKSDDSFFESSAFTVVLVLLVLALLGGVVYLAYVAFGKK